MFFVCSFNGYVAIFGWDTIKEAEKYTAKANQRRLAESAMHLLDIRDVKVD
jgi:hypothetical protein